MRHKRNPEHSEEDKGKKEDISGSEQPLSFQDLPYDIFSIISTYLPSKDLASLAGTCHRNADWASDNLEKREKEAASALLLAVVQGDEAKAKLIGNPALACSARGMATDSLERLIQDLTPFQVALCNGDVEMCEMMKKDYFSQLEDGQAEMEKQFNALFPNGVEIHVKMQQDNIFDFNEILQAIIRAPDNEVTAALDKAFDNNLPLHLALEKFRKAFIKTSQSEIVFNPYHLLRAFEILDAEFNNLGNWNKRDLFWRQVIGFVQRYLPACYLQASAQGIYYIVKNKEPLWRSFDFRLGGGSILPARNFSGLGFDFAGIAAGSVWRGAGSFGTGFLGGRLGRHIFENYVSNKNIKLGEIIHPNPAVQSRTWCVIL